MIEKIYETELGTLYHGLSTELVNVIAPESVALIYTDPPYPKVFIQTYFDLGDIAPVLLVDGGSLISIIPHFSLPVVINYISERLKWRWLLHMNQWDGAHARLSMGVEITFKPMGWWVKNRFPKSRWGGHTRDGIIITGKAGQNKELHKWEQDIQWCEYYITKLAKEGELVLDPYIGSGTVAIACEKLGRKWIGCDIDEKAIETTINRLKQYARGD